MTEVTKQSSRAFPIAVVAIVMLAGLLLVGMISYRALRNVVPVVTLINTPVKVYDGPAEDKKALAKSEKSAAALSDQAIVRRLAEFREMYDGTADKESVENEHYFELLAITQEFVRRIRSKPDFKARLAEIFKQATAVEIEKDRVIPIVAGENCAVNTTVWMYPPFPTDMNNENAFALVDVSAKLNGRPVDGVDTSPIRGGCFLNWFKYQLRSDQFKPGANTLSVQAHIRVLVDHKSGARTKFMEWDTPVVTQTIMAEPRSKGDLVKQISRPEDVVSVRQNARARVKVFDRKDRFVSVKFDFPAVSAPICAVVTITAPDGSWSTTVLDKQVIVVPAEGGKPDHCAVASFGENVPAPFDDNLRVTVEVRPAPQQALWKQMPEIAGFCARWENIGVESGKHSKGVLPTTVEADCSADKVAGEKM